MSADTEKPGERAMLFLARSLMKQALEILDEHSASSAAPSLDLAIHYLDREIEAL